MHLKNNWFRTKSIRQLLKKKKKIDPCERSVFLLLEQYKEEDSDNQSLIAPQKKHMQQC